MINLRYQNKLGKLDDIVLEALMSPGMATRLSATRWILALFGGICALVGIIFTALGARPVLGFMGIEIVLLYVAYRYCVRSSRMAEQLILSGRNAMFRRIDRDGNISITSFESHWLHVEIRHENDGSSHLILMSKGRVREVGAFLAPTEKIKLLDTLKKVLMDLRTMPELVSET